MLEDIILYCVVGILILIVAVILILGGCVLLGVDEKRIEKIIGPKNLEDKPEVKSHFDQLNTLQPELLGKNVRVLIDVDNDVWVEGQLLKFDDGGEFMLRDEMGFTHWCWPALNVQKLEE